jgi:hypothetical protein
MTNEAPVSDFPNRWREALDEMQREWGRLQQKNAQLRMERDQLSKALLALLSEEVTLNEEAILAQLGREKPLREFLQELRAQLAED